MTTRKINSFALGLVFAGLACSSTLSLRAAEDEVKYQPFTLSPNVSTLGFGVDARWRFADHFGVRGGVDYLGYSKDGEDIEGARYNADLRLFSAPLSLDVYPWENRSIRVSIGALINKNQLKGFSPSTGAGTFVEIGGVLIDSGAVGDISLKVEQQTFSPFVSVGGDFSLNRSKSLSLGLEVGVAYTGSPDVTLTRSNGPDAIDTQMAIERQQIEDKMKDYKFYPIVKVSLNFAF